MNAEAEAVRQALDILRTGGWIQGAAVAGSRHCLMGAIDATEAPYLVGGRVYAVLCDVIAEHCYGIYVPAMWWNDQIGRTFAEVEAVLEKTIARLEEEVCL